MVRFDHLDVNRHPFMFPDWTHTNSVVYSPDDKDLIISMRHQFWVIKIDYNNGQGTGDIVWKLGFQGDFTLQNGTDPIDWFYAQHDANVASSNSSGVFQLTMFDNGNNRILDTTGNVCGTTTPCASRVPILQLDESAKTATIEWVNNLSPVFSFFGGNSELLTNGNVEFDECASSSDTADVFEVTKTTPPETIWHMHISGSNAYPGDSHAELLSWRAVVSLPSTVVTLGAIDLRSQLKPGAPKFSPERFQSRVGRRPDWVRINRPSTAKNFTLCAP